MKTRAVSLLFLASSSLLWGRLGETEKELVARFGQPISRSKHAISAQGKTWELGPKLTFKQEEWQITSELVDGRVVRANYQKRGEWTPEQIQTVLAANAQGATWIETSKGGGKYSRTWKRTDGAVADSYIGISLTTPAYTRAKEQAEAKAKVEVSRTPKI